MNVQAVIKATEFHLPEHILTNEMLSSEFPEWSVEKIEAKTGISQRHIAAEDESASDLGIAAARKLFASGVCTPQEVDFVLFCTQSPDFLLPTTACVVQNQLGIPTSAGALDFNLGCSGFVYGLGLAKGLIESGQASKVLLITAESYSKYIHAGDKSVRTLFGDAGAATLVLAEPVQVLAETQGASDETKSIGPFVWGTDGSGACNLVVPAGGARQALTAESHIAVEDGQGNKRAPSNLFMNGAEVFAFTLRAVPESVRALLAKSGNTLEDVDLFVFHQANRYMLDHLRKKIGIPSEKFVYALADFGNTVSPTIPIALKCAQQENKLKRGDLVMLVGFGVGYSWGATLVRWV